MRVLSSPGLDCTVITVQQGVTWPFLNRVEQSRLRWDNIDNLLPDLLFTISSSLHVLHVLNSWIGYIFNDRAVIPPPQHPAGTSSEGSGVRRSRSPGLWCGLLPQVCGLAGLHFSIVSESEDDHFSDASEGRQSGSRPCSRPQSPIPRTRLEKIDTSPSYGEVPGSP